MKHYRLNQIAMAVLGALLLFFGTRTLIDILYQEHEPEKPGLEVATDEKPKEGEKPSDGAAAPEVLALLATADAKQGEEDAALCKVCHTFEKGGAALIGPNLHDIVGRKIASVEGFNYSPALKAKQSEGVWDYAHIDAFITNPQAYAPGTMMAFPGVPDVKKRANIIAFLRTQTDNPPPLPEAAPAAAPAEEKAPEAAEPAPAPEETAPAEEAPAAEPEAPAAEPEAPAAEPETPTAEPEAPAAEPEAPAAEEPAAAEEPKAEEPAPAEEAAPSAGEEPNPAWPQPVVPPEPTEPAEGTAPHSEAPAASEAPSASSEESNPAWPQPVYPDGQAESGSAASADDAAGSSGEASNPAWPQPVYPDGSPN